MNKGQEKQFGFFIAVVLLVLGLWQLFMGSVHAWAWIAAAVALTAITALFPRCWTPVLRVWLPIAHLLGWINTRLILGAVFFVLIMPVGWLLRILGHDPLHLRGKQGQTYWESRGKDWPPASFKDPF